MNTTATEAFDRLLHPGYLGAIGNRHGAKVVKQYVADLKCVQSIAVDLLAALEAYGELHDGLSDMIEDGRAKGLSETDYQWMADSLERLVPVIHGALSKAKGEPTAAKPATGPLCEFCGEEIRDDDNKVHDPEGCFDLTEVEE